MSLLLSISIATYCSIKWLVLNYLFSHQNNKSNGNGIIYLEVFNDVHHDHESSNQIKFN
jgi:hypothetical protein